MEQFQVAFVEKLISFLNLAGNPIALLMLLPLLACALISGAKPGDHKRIRGYAVVFSALTLLVALLMLTGLPDKLRRADGSALTIGGGEVLIRDAAPYAQKEDAPDMLREYRPLGQFQPFDAQVGLDQPQFALPVEQYKWLTLIWGEQESFTVGFNVGVDGLSMPFVLLTAFIFLLVVLWSLKRTERIKHYYAWLMLLQVGITGTFVALDLLLFYLFWELMLIPMYFLIAGWGANREQASRAAIRFFMFTMGGSVFYLISIIAIQIMSGAYDFSVVSLLTSSLSGQLANWLPTIRLLMFIGIMICFAVKLPLFPLHAWLPEAHSEAPAEISVILAALMLKTGGYAMIRIGYSVFPDSAHVLAPLIGILGVIGIVYGALVTLTQTDFKRMVAYSSISHMGFVALGIASLNPVGLSGAIYQMVAHGLVIACLFFIAGLLEERYGTRDIREIAGLLKAAPRTAHALFIAGLASMGFPFLALFWGELLVLQGSFYNNPTLTEVKVLGGDASGLFQLLAALAVLGILISVVYIWRMLSGILGGEPSARAMAAPAATEDRGGWPGPPLRLQRLEIAAAAAAGGASFGSAQAPEQAAPEAGAQVPAEPVATATASRREGYFAGREWIVQLLALLIILLGFMPQPLLNMVQAITTALGRIFLAT